MKYEMSICYCAIDFPDSSPIYACHSHNHYVRFMRYAIAWAMNEPGCLLRLMQFVVIYEIIIDCRESMIYWNCVEQMCAGHCSSLVFKSLLSMMQCYSFHTPKPIDLPHEMAQKEKWHLLNQLVLNFIYQVRPKTLHTDDKSVYFHSNQAMDRNQMLTH